MFGYLVRRVVSGLLVVISVTFVLFVIFAKGPNEPALAYCPKGTCTAEQLAIIETNLGLDKPLMVQFGTYLKGIVAGRTINSGSIELDCGVPCLGYSFKKFEMVTPYLLERFPATLSIAVGASVVFLTVGVAIGVISARNRGTSLDRGLQGGAMFVTAVPYYLVALLAFLFLVSKWGIFPNTGYFPITENPWQWFQGMLLAWLVLGLFYTTAYIRYSRGSMVEALNEDYVRTARAKGLTDRRVALKHALRAALVPIVTIFGLDFATILAGTIFTERIFSIQGIGLEALLSIGQQDLPVISATVLIAAAFVVVSNIVVDVAYAALDPRVRL